MTIFVLILCILACGFMFYRLRKSEMNLLEFKIAMHQDLTVQKQFAEKTLLAIEQIIGDLRTVYSNQVFLQKIFEELHAAGDNDAEKTKPN